MVTAEVKLSGEMEPRATPSKETRDALEVRPPPPKTVPKTKRHPKTRWSLFGWALVPRVCRSGGGTGGTHLSPCPSRSQVLLGCSGGDPVAVIVAVAAMMAEQT